MIFTPGVAIAAASGSIGGTVFSHNRGGPYTRNRSIPITSTTPEALAAKARLTGESQAWQGLTEGQRDAWTRGAAIQPRINALGFARALTGAQFFIGINTRRAAVGDARLLSPPIVAAPAPLTSVVQDGDIGVGDVDIEFTETPLGATEQLYMRVAVANSQGINNVQNQLRLLPLSPAAQVSPFDNQTVIEDRFGTLIVGQKLFLELSVYDNATGLLSLPLASSVIITTT